MHPPRLQKDALGYMNVRMTIVTVLMWNENTATHTLCISSTQPHLFFNTTTTFVKKYSTPFRQTISNFLMQRQQLSTKDWSEAKHLFNRVAKLSEELSQELADDQNAEMVDSDDVLDYLEAIMADVLHGIQKIDPKKAQEIEEMSQGSFVNLPEASSLATASLGASSTHGQRTDPQGHLIAPQQSPMATPARHCTSCGTVTTPEWHKGPQGPGTLCNACGLIYAKMKKRQEQGEEEEEEEEESSQSDTPQPHNPISTTSDHSRESSS